MGDDLYIAREFSNAALADISAMSAIESPHDAANIEQMSVKLARLQSGAKRLRARAIYRSAQIVIDGLSPSSTSEENFNTRLSALSNLVTQYAAGVSEIENAQIQDKLEQADTPDIETLPSIDISADLSQPDNKSVIAKQILTELLPLTRGDEAVPLRALMDYDPNAAPKPDSLTAKLEPRPQESELLSKPESNPDTSPQIPLEYVLRDAIQDALSIARMSGKTISISYDVGQKHISERFIAPLERRLCEGLRALILQSLPQDGIGHIDINLYNENMVICSKHKTPRLLPQGLETRNTAVGCEITLPIIAENQTLPIAAQQQDIIEPPNIDTENLEMASTRQAHRPMITADTEEQLRAQLGALMQDQAAPELEIAGLDTSLHMDDNIIVMTDEAAKNSKPPKRDAGTDEIGVSV